MIKQLSIKNFKSIRQLDLSCRRVNVFIGEPNAGKTNVLEALSLHCPEAMWQLDAVTRVSLPAQLHFNNDLRSTIVVSLDDRHIELSAEGRRWVVSEGDDDGVWTQMAYLGDGFQWHDLRSDERKDLWPAGTLYYLFNPAAKPASDASLQLRAPFGQNLASLLISNKSARQQVAKFFEGSGFKMRVDSGSESVAIAREMDDTLISFSYAACSETMRRMIFYHLALDTNEKRVLIFDEPEAHAYPPYTKILAEKMASDDRGNQFFLTTHSPYMLTSLISKTPAADLNVVLCRMENFETKAYVMSDEQKVQLMEWGMSAFFNFDRLVDDES